MHAVSSQGSFTSSPRAQKNVRAENEISVSLDSTLGVCRFQTIRNFQSLVVNEDNTFGGTTYRFPSDAHGEDAVQCPTFEPRFLMKPSPHHILPWSLQFENLPFSLNISVSVLPTRFPNTYCAGRYLDWRDWRRNVPGN